MATSSGKKHRRTALFIGLLITVLAAGAYQLGWLDWFEAKAYDACFHMLPASQRVPDCGKIVHVDIDDTSLGQFGRWPWPRTYLAGVVDVLSELSAQAVVLDIIMPEPQQPRPRVEIYSRNSDLLGRNRLIGIDPFDYIDDDRELSMSIARSGRTFLSMHFEPGKPIVAPTTLPDHASERLFTGPGQAWVRSRTAAMMQTEPDAPASRLAEVVYPSAAGESGPVQDLLFSCFRQVKAMRLLRPQSLPADGGAARWPEAAVAVPPIPVFAQAARGVGFVSVEPDPDGSMRAVPLMMNYDGRVYPQLVLGVACNLLDVPLERVRVDGHSLVLPDAKLPGGRSELRIPLDADGRMLINWRHPSTESDYGFRRVPISMAMDIVDSRRLIREKQDLLQTAVQVHFGDDSEQFKAYLASRRFIDGQSDDRTPPELRGQYLAAATTQMAELEQEAVAGLKVFLAQAATRPRESFTPDEQDKLAFVATPAGRLLLSGGVTGEIGSLQRRNAELLARLRPDIAGKVCFVGSVATGAADFVNTPLLARCPGVVVHSNILNTMLTGRFIRPTPWWANLLAILLCGLVATALTTGFGPRLSGLLVLATMTGVLGANVLLVFGRMSQWIVLAGPLLAIFASSGGVMLYRWWTEARQRRWVTQLLGSYTSPAVARRISEQNNLLALSGEQRVITCMFTDLKGFTPLSERLGTEQTVKLLNRYFDRMSEVLLHHEATISKFLGDGIFAFFGAPDVMIDHPRRAAAAAIDLREELRLFCRELADEGAPQLAMRIGLATGQAMFGNCGSSKKFDYTALGPTVNMASRLEGANKFFGTSIMVSVETAAQCEQDFVLRPLGQVKLIGVQQPVRVSELVARLADSRESERTWAARFGGAVELYAARKFAKAAEEFDALRRPRPNDRATQIYVDLCQATLSNPPGDGWSPVIVLTEK